MSLRAGARPPAFRSCWWRTCIAWYALLALAWPSLGPLPYLVHDFGIHDHAAHAHAGAAHDDDHADASSIPGSPTHPIDHDCPECRVLKHLSRCMLPVLAIAFFPPVVVGFSTRRIIVARPPALVPAHLPPVRAPPARIA